MIVSLSNSKRLNEIVESFEANRALHADCDFAQFLPSTYEPNYHQIAVELMRVDLENSWRCGNPIPLEDYRKRFADVLSESQCFQVLAYEDYRLKLTNGLNIQREDYQHYGIETDDWPLPTDQIEGAEIESGAIDHLAHEVQRLTDAICDFPEAGDSFDGMEIESQIGRGAFGRVFLARQNTLSRRQVVLKISANETFEPQRLARLQHTNIVPIYSVHSDGSLSGICMPFFGRATLGDLLSAMRGSNYPPKSGSDLVQAITHSSNGHIANAETTSHNANSIANDFLRTDDSADAQKRPATKTDGSILKILGEKNYQDACLTLLLQIADGLKHAVSRGILHRDLKPANILISDEGTPLLLDFNVSDDIVPGGKICLTVGGTLPYMSPEQLQATQDGQRVDQRSDIYSFGILLLELLTRRHPFLSAEANATDQHSALTKEYAHGEHIDTVVQNALQQRKAFQADHGKDGLSSAVHAIVEKCLAYDVHDRYQSFDEVGCDIERHLNHLPLVYAPNRSIGERLAKWTLRHPRLSSATSVMMVSLVLVVSLIFFAVIRSRQLQRAQALNIFSQIEQKLPRSRALLSSISVHDPGFDEGRAIAEEILQSANINDLEGNFDESLALLGRVSKSDAAKFRSSLVEVMYLLANAERRLGQADDENSADHLSRAIALNQAAQDLSSNDGVSPVLLWQQRNLNSLKTQSPASPAETWNEQFPVPDSGDRMLVALQYCDSQEWAKAIPIFEEACRADSTNPFNHYLLATMYSKFRRYSEAESAYSACIGLSPDSFFGYFQRGKIYLETKRYQQAIDDFTRALQIDATSYEALMNRALAFKSENRPADSDKDLTAAIGLRPDELRPFFIRSRVRTILGQHELAKQDLARGFTLPAKTVKDWLVRGDARVKDHPDDALEDYREALNVNPTSRDALLKVAYVLAERKDDHQGALDVLDQIMSQGPVHPNDIASRGVLYARLGEKEKAQADAAQALELSRDGQLLYKAACVFALTADNNSAEDHAISLLSEAIQMDRRCLRAANDDPDLETLRKNRRFKAIVYHAAMLDWATRNLKKSGK